MRCSSRSTIPTTSRRAFIGPVGPLRWAATSPDGWQADIQPGELTVRQQFEADLGEGEPAAWIRYRHLLPDLIDWQEVRDLRNAGSLTGDEPRQWDAEVRPQLVTDFNPYNARILRGQAVRGTWQVDPAHQPKNWVGDLAVECHVKVAKPGAS